MKGNEELQGSQIYVNTANTWFTDFSDIAVQSSPVQSSQEERESTISELSFLFQQVQNVPACCEDDWSCFRYCHLAVLGDSGEIYV